jgi:response regulator RpfG family c-di-GMP phosphodiesterase
MERKLLLVDDDESSLKTLVMYLGKNDYTLLTATGCSEAFDILKKQNINVVVSDFRMPDMNGIDFLKEVSRYWPDTVRIIISGYIELNLLIDAFNNEIISKFIPKPWIDYNIRKIINDSFKIHDLNKLFKKISSSSYKNAEALFESLPAGLLVLDRTGKILSINQIALKLLGLKNTDNVTDSVNNITGDASGSLSFFTDLSHSQEISAESLFIKLHGKKYRVKPFNAGEEADGFMIFDY